MKKLGAIIAGGMATRFGGDKAAAILDGHPLIEHVAGGLGPQVGHMIICGREWPGMHWLPDRPHANMGPLAGLNAALHFAQHHGFDTVLTAGCDVLPVPHFPADNPMDKAMFIRGHYLFGIWPSRLAAVLDHHLTSQSDHSMRGWIAATVAIEIPPATLHYNLNSQSDLEQFSARKVGAA